MENAVKHLAEYYNQLIEADTTQDLFSCVVSATADIAKTELSQLFLLDQSQTALNQYGQFFLDQAAIKQNTHINYYDNPLLQYCLTQGQTFISDNISPLLETSFLPCHPNKVWRSILLLPIYNRKQICGVLACASFDRKDISVTVNILKHFCRLALIQYPRLLKLQFTEQHPADIANTESLVIKTSDYRYGLVGDSKAMHNVHFLISKVLHTPYTVLLTGETGTGKEVVAKAIHNFSGRKNKAFVVQNCASVPENLLESELFGYCKGAFTGADKDFLGIFRQADNGTLFLDEIGDMPLNLQAKLLRVLQENEVRPLGSTKTYKINVRVIAATHCNLEEKIKEGKFREDLYYRLAQFPIELPPLRERDKDIITLAHYFIKNACELLDRKLCKPSKAFLDTLLNYPFPGNVRELKVMLERAILLADGELLEPQHLHLKTTANTDKVVTDTGNYKDNLKNYERQQLLDCLKQNNGNQTKTAKKLGISRRTLLYKLQRFNISKTDINI